MQSDVNDSWTVSQSALALTQDLTGVTLYNLTSNNRNENKNLQQLVQSPAELHWDLQHITHCHCLWLLSRDNVAIYWSMQFKYVKSPHALCYV